MSEGAQVVRVSLRSDEGKIDERGVIRKVHTDEAGKIFGYTVEWSEPARLAYVAPVRIVSLKEWQQEQGRKAGA